MYDLLNETEEMLSGLVKNVCGTYETVLHRDGQVFNINWKGPWRRIQMIPTLEEMTGEKFPPADQLHTDESLVELQRICDKMNVKCEIKTASKLIDAMVGDLIEPTIKDAPAFIIGHPQM